MAITEDPAWVQIQKKTFTKWMNSHLIKKSFPAIENAQDDFETGVNLMNLINSLYGLDIPKHNKAPKMRPHKLDNITLALKMLEEAQVKTNFLKSVHLADHDLKMILGMIWSIILDFQIKGINVEELTAKEGLLLWCQKKTAGYRDVKVENFTSSWVNGLAFCALIHRHRPDLLDYDPLDKNDAAKNLELAFDIAEKQLGIPRLLDVEDLTNVAKPDERSIMTYVSEYFHCFAGMDLKELAARRIQKFVRFNQGIENDERNYESQAIELLSWISAATERMSDSNFGTTAAEAKEKFEQHKNYLFGEKPLKAAQKLDLEALFADIQTKLAVYGRAPYEVPNGLGTDDIDSAWDRLEQIEKQRGRSVRDNMFKFISKLQTSITPEQLREFEASFAHFDKDGSNYLDKIEFKAALSALSIPFKDGQAFNTVFDRVAQGNPKVSKEQFVNYLVEINEDKDNAEQIKESFASLADHGDKIMAQQLRVPPLIESEINYLQEKMPVASGEFLDYVVYTDKVFRQ